MMDEKLKYFSDEVMKFIEVLTHTTGEEDYNIDIVNTAKMLGNFYDKYKDRYNEKQLVNQFIKRTFGSDAVKLYSKLKQTKGMFA